MTTVRSAQHHPIPRGLAIAPLLLVLGALAPAAAVADPLQYDDVSYGDIPAASFGQAIAAPANGAIADGRDDVLYGAPARAAIAGDSPATDEAIALRYDDVTYPAAEPQRAGEAAVATSNVAEGNEVRASSGSRVAAVGSAHE